MLPRAVSSSLSSCSIQLCSSHLSQNLHLLSVFVWQQSQLHSTNFVVFLCVWCPSSGSMRCFTSRLHRVQLPRMLLLLLLPPLSLSNCSRSENTTDRTHFPFFCRSFCSLQSNFDRTLTRQTNHSPPSLRVGRCFAALTTCLIYAAAKPLSVASRLE